MKIQKESFLAIALAMGMSGGMVACGGSEPAADDTEQTDDDIEPGTTSESITFEMVLGDWGEDGVAVVVDDDGSGVAVLTECDLENNIAYYDDAPCTAE